MNFRPLNFMVTEFLTMFLKNTFEYQDYGIQVVNHDSTKS